MASLAKLGRFGAPCRVPEALGSVYMVKRHKTVNSNVTNYKRGTGGRSSFSGIVATVFGGNSSLGHLVINRLGKIGSQVIVPYRGDPYSLRAMRMYGDLGQILFHPLDLRSEKSVAEACRYSNVVINLIGKPFETKNWSFNDVHVEGARRIARVAREEGVGRLIHVSAMGAGLKTSNVIPEGSKWLMSKGEGEKAVREEFPEAVIMRPSDFIDEHDVFLSVFLKRRRYYKVFTGEIGKSDKMIPIWGSGLSTIKMPVLPRDVAAGIMAAITDPQAPGKTYQCVGPNAYRLADLLKYLHQCILEEFHLSSKMGLVVSRTRKWEKWYQRFGFPRPMFTCDRLERDSISDTLDPSLPTLESLGVTPENVERTIFWSYKDIAMEKDKEALFENKKLIQPTGPTPEFATLQ